MNARTSQQTVPAPRFSDCQSRTLKDARAALGNEPIVRALFRHGGRVTRAAQKLGINRPCLYQLMDKLWIQTRSPKDRTSRNSRRVGGDEINAGEANKETPVFWC